MYEASAKSFLLRNHYKQYYHISSILSVPLIKSTPHVLSM